MKDDKDSIGKGIGTFGLWLGIGAISFSGVVDANSTVVIVILGLLGTAAIWNR